jgi:hypothetical protein
MGFWMARSILKQVDEATGQKGVLESKLIATTVKGNEIPPLDAVPPAQTNVDNVSKKLKDLQKLKADGLITDDEYEKKRKQILDEF